MQGDYLTQAAVRYGLWVLDSVVSRLAGVVTLSLSGRGPKWGFVFDPHRLALPCWSLATNGASALLITVDRHFDLVPPLVKTPLGLSVLELDEHARRLLDVRNYDHILAAVEAGLISDVIAIARASPVGSFEGSLWREQHQIVRARTLDALCADFGTERASTEARQAFELIERAERIVLDVDVDCFTSPSDADPTTVLPWPEPLIREHLVPRSAEPFWSAVLPKCVGLTIAREPNHCGGLIAGAHLFEQVANVLFTELLHTDLP